MTPCDATYTEHQRRRRVRLTDDEPAYEEWDDRYACEREADHRGDHHGPLVNPQPDRPDLLGTWPVQPPGMSLEDAARRGDEIAKMLRLG